MTSLKIDFNKLAYWTYNIWNLTHVWTCFGADDEIKKEYWTQKYDTNVLYFYLSLDEPNKERFLKYLDVQLSGYFP